jgi:hypothetical protein
MTGKSPAMANIYVDMSFDENVASYYIAVPAKYAGRKFALILTGDARIEYPTSGVGSSIGMGPSLPPQMVNRSAKCSPGISFSLTGMTSLCQVIFGTFPGVQNAGPIGDPVSGCLPEDSAPLTARSGFIWTLIQGTVNVATQPSWGHVIYALPSFDYLSGGTTVNQVEGIGLNGWYSTGFPTGCLAYRLPSNYEVTDTSVAASETFDGWLAWNNEMQFPVTVAARSRNNDMIANLLIALGAATASLSLGFIPVTYEANRSRKRESKRKSRDRNP